MQILKGRERKREINKFIDSFFTMWTIIVVEMRILEHLWISKFMKCEQISFITNPNEDKFVYIVSIDKTLTFVLLLLCKWFGLIWLENEKWIERWTFVLSFNLIHGFIVVVVACGWANIHSNNSIERTVFRYIHCYA